MNTVCSTYDALAGLLTYPGPDYRRRVARCHDLLAENQPEAAALIARFEAATAGLSDTGLEELFTHTFDLSPVCSLEVGWHLYGENYSRGEFLVTMRQQLREHRLPESTELPDHMTHVLAAVCRMKPAQADRFTTTYVLPALEKMLAGLSGKDCPYEHVLEAIRSVLLSPYGAVMSM
ncbi:MAG TPA: nitrate reductase molybdenum cofactor assembly chaperone [Gemmataceae bacterium]|nr:nitrate reductase molybdenum cofactor assembly chaperone [Gemmataceae bacterium]